MTSMTLIDINIFTIMIILIVYDECTPLCARYRVKCSVYMVCVCIYTWQSCYFETFVNLSKVTDPYVIFEPVSSSF